MTYAIDNRPAKGTAIVARRCVEELLKAQDRFDLTFIHYEHCDDPIYTHGIREVILPEFPLFFLNKRSLRQIYYFFTTTDRFDIIQWFQPRLYPFFWKAPASRIVVEVHGAGDVAKEAPFDVMRLIFNWTVKTFNRRIDAAIVASVFAKEDIVKQYGFLPSQVRVIYNGVDPSFTLTPESAIVRVKRTYNLPDHFFLNVARLNPNKNALRTMQAFEAFARSRPTSDLHFVNIGSEGTEKAQVSSWLSESPYRDRIHIIPFVETVDLPAVYGAAYALTFPLLNEGFGLPAIEAMACGTPVLVAETAQPEITNREAILVDAYTTESIADGMRLLADEPQLRDAFIVHGR